MPYDIMIARFPGGQQEHPDSSDYVIDLVAQLSADNRIGKVHTWKISDTPITMCRNRAVMEAARRKCHYLLMIDSDMSPDCEPGAPEFWPIAWDFMMGRREAEQKFAVDHWGRQLATDALSHSDCHKAALIEFPPATIAAPYCGPPPVECVYVFRWAGKETGAPNPSFRLEMIDRDDAATRTGIEEVAALPTGLILYDTRVFQKLAPPWFQYEFGDIYQERKVTTEDVFQTRNASLMGLPQFCTWDCWAGHMKLKKVQKPLPLSLKAIRKEFADAILKYQDAQAKDD